MLNDIKRQKLTDNLKAYIKRFLSGSIVELDESGTRIMINHFLTDVLGFAALEEVRTEYMIKGTYADYMVQINGKRHFLVEVKAFSLALNENHLRQAINYGANEGVEWALLTNGKQFDLYKILFEKPIQHKLVFSLKLTGEVNIKHTVDVLQYLCKELLLKNGLDTLWTKTLALTPESLAKILLSYDSVNNIRKEVNKTFNTKFENEQIQQTLLKIITEKIDAASIKVPKLNQPVVVKKAVVSSPINIESNNSEQKAD